LDKTRRFWDNQSKNWDKSEGRFDPALAKVLRRSEKYLKKDDTVLDFGCGTGTRSLELAPFVRRVIGLDISPKMIEHAREKAKEQRIENADFTDGTIFDEICKVGSFDAVVSFGVIHLLEDYKDVLRRINELLKPGGLFISTTACLREHMTFRDRFVLSIYLFVKKIGLFPYFLNLLKNSDVDEIIEGGDFRIIESENYVAGISIYFVAAEKK
jgi:2-polyprenyl-3-methyl-5-hydroxy-6-metoxy-1,4-benzoquinol methylase